MASPLRLPKSKAHHIDGAQFRFGLDEVGLSPERFADLFCNGRVKRVHEWLAGELPVPPWVPALLAAMVSPEGRTRAIATAEHLIAAGASSGSARESEPAATPAASRPPARRTTPPTRS